MPRLDEFTLVAFRAELRKEAGFTDLVARAAPTLKNMSSLGGAGATVGALGGAGLGAVRGYRAARAQGEDVGGAVTGALGGAARGAGKGALFGGLAGAGAGAASGMGAGLTQRGGILGAGARFGQRQVHSMTGMLSPAELEGVRGGAYGAREHLAKATAALDRAPLGAAPRAQKAVGRAQKALATTEAATGVTDPSMNLTSLPGYLQAARQHGMGKMLSTGVKEQIANSSPAMTALMIGAPAVGVAKTLAGKEETDASGRGRFERAGEDAGRTIGGVTGGVMPIVGQGLVGGALGRVGKYTGRGIDRLRGKGGQPGMTATTLEPAEMGQHMPTEKVTSPAAAGQQADIGL